jgi:hypothetical protein
MKTLYLISFSILISFSVKSQYFIFTEVGNSILTRPNLGYEYRWKNQGLGAAIQWQRHTMFWVAEWPSLIKTKGIRGDVHYRFFYKSFFMESKLRLQTHQAPDVLNGWHDIVLYNSKNSIELAEKIGFLFNRNKRFQFDFGAGVGLNYGNKNMWISNMERYVGPNYTPLSDTELLAKFPNKNLKGFLWLPHAQIRMYYRIRE